MAIVLLGACAGNSGGGGKTISSRDVLTREQIAKTRATNAYEAVERLRSNWLRQRGSTQMDAPGGGPQFRQNQVQIYFNDQRLGDPESLQRIEIAAVDHIRYYSPAEASARWGFNHGGGAIVVHSRPADQQQ